MPPKMLPEVCPALTAWAWAARARAVACSRPSCLDEEASRPLKKALSPEGKGCSPLWFGEIERLDEPRLNETAKDYTQKSPVHPSYRILSDLVSVPLFSAIFECGVISGRRSVNALSSSSLLCAKVVPPDAC